MFFSGAISSNNKKVREKAIEFIKGAKDYASAVGADKVHCAPLNDGFEYIFQENYSLAWKNIIESVSEICDYRPEIDLVLEYKDSEPRANCFIDSAAKALLLCNKVGRSNIGITLDFGHALQRGENPANELSIIADSGVPFYIHINDNNRKWDWDMIPASHNFLQYVEFIFWLREYKYSDFLAADVAPCRLDIRKTFETTVRITSKIWDLAENLAKKEIKKLISSGDYFKVSQLIESDIYKL
jgi:xylose isomerase